MSASVPMESATQCQVMPPLCGSACEFLVKRAEEMGLQRSQKRLLRQQTLASSKSIICDVLFLLPVIDF